MIPQLLARHTARWSGRLFHHSSRVAAAAATNQQLTSTLLHVSANAATVEAEWSQQANLASPPVVKTTNTTTSESLQVSANGATMESEWAHHRGLGNAPHNNKEDKKSNSTVDAARREETVQLMMEQLLMSSPESALGVSHVAETMDQQARDDLKALFARQNKELPQPVLATESSSALDPQAVELMLQQMLLACPESATGFSHVAETLTEDLRAELITACLPLPSTLEDALNDQARAIVVTTAQAPFRVVHVNHVWEGLCGYSLQEAQDQPIGQLLQGPETRLTRPFVDALQSGPSRHPPLATSLVNYTKTGRKFHNRLQVGPLFATAAAAENKEQQKQVVEYLVGVLQEVDEQGRGIQQLSPRKMTA